MCLLKNEARTRGRREKGRVLVVVQRKEASMERKDWEQQRSPQRIYKDKGWELCHSTWCPQTGNRVHDDHNPHLRYYNSEQTGLFLSADKGEEGQLGWLTVER